MTATRRRRRRRADGLGHRAGRRRRPGTTSSCATSPTRRSARAARRDRDVARPVRRQGPARAGEDADAALARITTTTDLDAVGDADIVVEAVFEQPRGQARGLPRARSDLPRRRGARHEHQRDPDHPDRGGDRAAGDRRRHPLLLAGADDGAVRAGPRLPDQRRRRWPRARAFAEAIGKTCVVVNRDVAGFVTTRLICALAMEAVAAGRERRRVGRGRRHRLPARLRPRDGTARRPWTSPASTSCATRRMNIYADTADEKFFPPEMLARMVAAGDLGRKSGRGFYTYDS